MTENELRDRYVATFYDPEGFAARSPLSVLEYLERIAEKQRLVVWRVIISARILRTRHHTAAALRMVEDAVAQDPYNPYALLLKAAILTDIARAEEDRADKDCKLTEAIALFDLIIDKYSPSAEPAMVERVAKAMLCKAGALDELGQYPEAAALAADLVQRYRSSKDKHVPRYVTQAACFHHAVMTKYGTEAQIGAAQKLALEFAEDPQSRIEVYLQVLRANIDDDRKVAYFDAMNAAEKAKAAFLSSESYFRDDFPFILFLREFNSYTPVVPDETEKDRGGGYFIRFDGRGIVVDPGYDFIENFARAGGRIHDITDIIVTHAHDDHTAQLESILMLTVQYNKKQQDGAVKRLRLYLSQGTERKFSGIIPSRDAKHIERVVVLSRAEPDSPQRIPLSPRCTITVLPAYHEDVITRDTAIGIGFEFTLAADVKRRVVFTGDTGLFPSGPGASEQDDKMVLWGKGRALYERYRAPFDKSPDLLVAHIGSMREYELKPLSLLDEVTGKKHDRFYPDHLGLLGTIVLIDKLRPKHCIISEWGEELKEIRFELVRRLREVLRAKHELDGQCVTDFILPSDLTIVYAMETGEYLCHQTCQFVPPERLVTQVIKTPETVESHRPKRLFLFLKCEDLEIAAAETCVEQYYKKLRQRQLPHFKQRTPGKPRNAASDSGPLPVSE